MPERQSSPGEVTRPEVGHDTNEPADTGNGVPDAPVPAPGHPAANDAVAGAAPADATKAGTAADVTNAETAADVTAPDTTTPAGAAPDTTPAGVATDSTTPTGATTSGETPGAPTATTASADVTSADVTSAGATSAAPPTAAPPTAAPPTAGARSADAVTADVAPTPTTTDPAPAGSGAPDPARPSTSVPTPAAGPARPSTSGLDAPTVATFARRPTHDGMGTWFNTTDSETTQVIPPTRAGSVPADGPTAPTAPATAATSAAPAAARTAAAPTATATSAAPDGPTEQIRLPPTTSPPPAGPPDGPAKSDGGTARGRKRALLAVGGVVVALGLAYGADLLFSSGSVPRGTTVAGVDVGTLSFPAAEQALRAQIEPRTTRPVAITAGPARSDLDPRSAGLAVDWTATLDRAGVAPLNPISRIASFFTPHEVGVATTTDRVALDAALAQLAPVVEKSPVEGTVRFDGVMPVAVDPVPGQKLDEPGAAVVLERDWVAGSPLALPLIEVPATTTAQDVATAVEKVAAPAVSAPVTVVGEKNTRGTLTPAVIAAALTFRPDPGAGLAPELNQDALVAALKPQLAASEQPGRDAELDFTSGRGVVVPSQDGRGIDYAATLKDLLTVLAGTDEREITAVYKDQPAKLTTAQLNGLGISGVIGEFETGGFAADSGQNIRRAANQINGKIVKPGETFSLNAATNPRDAAHGYVEAGIIEKGHAARGIGGGVSQVATTLYNASYFAGMTNVEHQEHSFYISRYPAGREATVFDDVIDLQFRNDNPTAVMIQTVWSPGSLTVRIFGSKVWEVSSAAGPRTNPTEPNTISLPAGDGCSPSRGAPGFTITNTRTLKNVKTGAVRTDPTRTVRYKPSPIVNCTG